MAAVLTLKNTGIEESPNGVGDILVIDLDGLDYDTGRLETPVCRAVLPDDGISGKGAQVISATQDADRYLIGNVMDYNRGLSTLEIARDAKGKITGAKMAAINLNRKRPINPNLFNKPFRWLNPAHANSTATVLQLPRPFGRRASHASPGAAKYRAPVHWLWPFAAASKSPRWHAHRLACR